MGHPSMVARSKVAGLSDLEKGCLLSWATEAIWTKIRIQAAGYAIPDALCDVCKAAPDTSFHRLFCCEGVPQLSSIRREIFSGWELQLLKDKGPSWLVARGLCRHPGDFIPLPLADGGVHFWCRDPTVDRHAVFSGKVYSDGSCLKHHLPEGTRAAWAIVTIDNEGELFAVLSGPVWCSLVQSSPAGEHAAAAALSQVVAGETTLLSDNMGVVKTAAQPSALALSHHRFHAGITKMARQQVGHSLVNKVLWVKAHRCGTAFVEKTEDWFDLRGNHFADVEAKKARDKHPSFKVPADVERDYELSKKVCLAAARILPHLPSLRSSFGRGKLERRASLLPRLHPAEEISAHNWFRYEGLWRCSACLAHTHSHTSKVALGRCFGMSCAVKGALSKARGHVVYVFDASPLFVVACKRCGIFGTRKFANFEAKCKGSRTIAGDKTWQQLQKGKHPFFARLRLGPAIRVRASDFREVDEPETG